jgi:PLP dependent protein
VLQALVRGAHPATTATAKFMLPDILNNIQTTCARVNRDPKGVQLIAVTKTRSLEQIRRHVLEYGNFVLGENRVQEALPKLEALPGAEFHLIGQLQTNKVKFCQGFKLLHGVDNTRILEELAKRGEGWGFVPPVLLEVNIAREPQKHGLMPEDVTGVLRAARDLNVTVRGLMTVAPVASEQTVRQVFHDLRLMRDTLGLEELSMGMSDDYMTAIEQGATMIRIGRALYEVGS